MTQSELKLACLQLANNLAQTNQGTAATDDVVKRAQAYWEFLSSSVPKPGEIREEHWGSST